MVKEEWILTVVSTSLSLVGCFVLFITYKVWSELRSKSRTILLYITLADFLTAVGYLAFSKNKQSSICVLQSFVTTMSSMMSFFWTCCLALYLYAITVRVDTDLGTRIVSVFHFIAWPLPFIITLVACLCHALGRDLSYHVTSDWCWIKIPPGNTTDNTASTQVTHAVLWMLFTGKLWEMLSYVIIVFAYVRIWLFIRQHTPQVRENVTMMHRVRSVEIRILMMPLAFIIIRVWGTIRFILFASQSSGSVVLDYLQAFGDGSQGFVNCVMFCLATEKVTKFCSQCCRDPSRESDSLLHQSVQNSVNYGADERQN